MELLISVGLIVLNILAGNTASARIFGLPILCSQTSIPQKKYCSNAP